MPPEVLTFLFNQTPLVVVLLGLVWALLKPTPLIYPASVVADLKLQRDEWKKKAEHATDLIALSTRTTISAVDLARAQRLEAQRRMHDELAEERTLYDH